MATPYSVPLKIFYHHIEQDRKFFNYFNLDDIQSIAIAKERALAYMEDALFLITIKCKPSVDFSNKNDITEQFNFDLNFIEKSLIPSIMYQYHLERDFDYIKLLDVNYTPTDLRVLDPSNARSTFLDIYKTICEHNESLLDLYKDADRSTNSYRTIDFNAYDDEETE